MQHVCSYVTVCQILCSVALWVSGIRIVPELTAWLCVLWCHLYTSTDRSSRLPSMPVTGMVRILKYKKQRHSHIPEVVTITGVLTTTNTLDEGTMFDGDSISVEGAASVVTGVLLMEMGETGNNKKKIV